MVSADARAQLYVGNMYRKGRGVPQNGAEALTWYRRAADQGLHEAQFYIDVSEGKFDQ